VNRLLIALVSFAALGAIAWSTLSDVRIRLATLAVLALFAAKTWVHRKDVMRADRTAEGEQQQPPPA
jgi:hypothetical protein